MNKNEMKALDIWKKNQSINVARMSWRELSSLREQQDRLYRYAHKRTDRRILGK